MMHIKISEQNWILNKDYIFKGTKYNKNGIESVFSEKLQNYCLKDVVNIIGQSVLLQNSMNKFEAFILVVIL